MSTVQQPSPATRRILSICIPTYNRADCLDDCLKSLEIATRKCRDRVQIVISDNASTDHTPDVVKRWSSALPILSVRNPTNIGGERNFFSSARHATAEYVWIFGDDDEFGDSAVTEFLRYIDQDYDIIVANYSSWSKDMQTVISQQAMSTKFLEDYTDPDVILSAFGILLGYISSVVVRRSILLSVPASEYEVFVPYGFPFPFSVYCGLPRPTRFRYIAEPLFRRREHNSDLLVQCHTTWLKYFIEGPALVFEALQRKGFSERAVLLAKTNNLRDFGIRNVVAGFDRINRRATRRMMYQHYSASWRFWLVWLPFLMLPATVVGAAVKLRKRLR